MTFQRTALFAAIAVLALVGNAAQAQATIDHDKAMAGNVTPGDGAGYPITLSVPGHYKLMSNLVVPAATGGILVTAPNVTLDLNGFSISGPVKCAADNAGAVTCNSQQAGNHGINAGNAPHFVVRNGNVHGFAYGILYGDGGLVDNLVVSSNVLDGVAGGNTSGAVAQVRDTRMEYNGRYGFQGQAMIVRSSVGSNGKGGIYNAGFGAMTMHSTVHRNGGFGIYGGAVLGNFSHSNKGTNMAQTNSMGGNLNGLAPY